MDGIHPSEDRKQILTVLGIGLFFIAACLIVSIAGPRSRVYSLLQISEVLPDSKSALEVWTSHNVRGRTLLLFDSKLHADSSRDSAVTNDNYIDAAITGNLVRRVIHVVPDGRWEEASRNLMATGLAAYSNGRLQSTIDGAPLEVTTLANLPPVREKVLVHINWEFFDSSPSAPIPQLLSSRSIDRDIVTMTGSYSTKSLPVMGLTNTEGVIETKGERLYRTPSPQSPPLKGGEVKTPTE